MNKIIPTIDHLADCRFRFWTEVFSISQRFSWYSSLMEETDWEQSEIRIFGKLHKIPRLNAWYGPKSMTYSGYTMSAKPMSPLLLEITDQLFTVTGETYNSVLLNLYRDGRDAMGWHSDDEPEFDPLASIASLSLGGTRKFVVKEKKKGGKLGAKLEDNR